MAAGGPVTAVVLEAVMTFCRHKRDCAIFGARGCTCGLLLAEDALREVLGLPSKRAEADKTATP
jgi:hypothetical protein